MRKLKAYSLPYKRIDLFFLIVLLSHSIFSLSASFSLVHARFRSVISVLFRQQVFFLL